MKSLLKVFPILAALLILSSQMHSQPAGNEVQRVLIGEYANYIIAKDSTVWTSVDWQLKKYPLPEKIVNGSAGHPNAVVIGLSGNVYLLKGGSTNWVTVPHQASSTASIWDSHALLTKSGSIIVWKDNGTFATLQSIKDAKSLAAGHRLHVLTADGSVYYYEWGNRPVASTSLVSMKPVKVVLPGAVSAITSSRSLFNSAIIDGKAYVWEDGSYGLNYIGKRGFLSIPGTVSQIAASDNTLHILTSKGEMYAIGDNALGELGTGTQHLNLKTHSNWMDLHLYQHTPARVATDRLYSRVEAGTSYAFRHMAIETNGHLNVWGYSKGGLLLNGIRHEDTNTAFAIGAYARPYRVVIAPRDQFYSTDQLRQLQEAGKYPPSEMPVTELPPTPSKTLTATIKIYSDGSIELEPRK